MKNATFALALIVAAVMALVLTLGCASSGAFERGTMHNAAEGDPILLEVVDYEANTRGVTGNYRQFRMDVRFLLTNLTNVHLPIKALQIYEQGNDARYSVDDTSLTLNDLLDAKGEMSISAPLTVHLQPMRFERPGQEIISGTVRINCAVYLESGDSYRFVFYLPIKPQR